MDQDATWCGHRPRPRHSVLDGDPALPAEGAQQPPTFRPMSSVAKRSPISATAELLLVTVIHCKYLFTSDRNDAHIIG